MRAPSKEYMDRKAQEATTATLREWNDLYRIALDHYEGDEQKARATVERYFDGILQGENARRNRA